MKKLSYERFLWFHQQVKDKSYPNATSLSRHFEISRKTAQRDIEFFTDRLNAPLQYCPSQRGYLYTDDTFEIPALWLKKEEIIALLFAKRLAASIPDKEIKQTLDVFLNKLAPMISHADSFDNIKMDAKISLQNVEYFDVDDLFFKDILEALFKEKALNIQYYSPYQNKESRRVIMPWHMLNYMGNWYLMAWCDEKKAIRTFALSRIKALAAADKNIRLPKNLPDAKTYFKKHFGIFSGKNSHHIVLRFTQETSRWVKDQIWHKSQTMQWDEKHRLILSLSVTDFREIRREILKFGSQVEVLKPRDLREDIKDEIKKMKKVYR